MAVERAGKRFAPRVFEYRLTNSQTSRAYLLTACSSKCLMNIGVKHSLCLISMLSKTQRSAIPIRAPRFPTRFRPHARLRRILSRTRMERLVLVAFSAIMNKISNPPFCITLRRSSARSALVICAGMLILLASRTFAGNNTTGTEKNPSDSLQEGSVEIRSSSATASKPSSADSKRATQDPQSLAGRSTDEVQAALGKPSGKLQNAEGALWLYAEWRVQFDHDSHVLKVEKDQPVRLSKLD